MTQTTDLQSLARKALPHAAVLLLFFIINSLYFYPQYTGMQMGQGDISESPGRQQEIIDYRKETGEQALWTNNIFVGQPGFYSGVSYKNTLKQVERAFQFFMERPIGTFIGLMSITYIALILMGLPVGISVIGAIGFGFATNNIILYEAGHMMKVGTLAYMPFIIGGLFLLIRKSFLNGFLLYTLGMGLSIYHAHIQMLYYLMLIFIVLGVIYLGIWIKEKKFSLLGTVIALALFGTILGVAANTARLWTTYEFADETMRGEPILKPVADRASEPSEPESGDQSAESQGSEVADSQAADTQGSEAASGGGLDWEYAMAWSNNTVDLLTGIIPGIAGGSSAESLDSGAAVDALRRAGVRSGPGGSYQLPLYWGALPSTSGPIYFGAVLLFLAVIGLRTVKSPVKWWLVSAILITVLLSYGKNAAWFNQFLFDTIPMFNKFRTPNSVLSVTTYLIPLLAVLGLYHWMKLGGDVQSDDESNFSQSNTSSESDAATTKSKSKSKAQSRSNRSKSSRNKNQTWLAILKQDPRTQPMLIALGITGGFALFIALFGTSLFSFRGANDAAYAESGLLPLLIEDRQSLLTGDAWRTLFYILGAAVIMTLAILKPTLRKEYIFAGLTILVTADFWGVNRRYIEPSDFQATQAELQEEFYAERPIDRQIKERETSRHDYRVLDLSINTFITNKTSFHHNTIGGYSAVKMRRIQDLIEEHISKMNMDVLNMLNTTYIITQQEQLFVNEQALGWAWFVDDIRRVDTPRAEIDALHEIDPARTAVVLDREFDNYTEGLQPTGTGTIERVEYTLDDWRYEYNTDSDQLAVFSEIWYKPEKGLHAYLNGERVDFIRANYALRAIKVPAGQGVIEFRFEPASFLVGDKITRATSFLLVFFILGLMGFRIVQSVRSGNGKELAESAG